VDAGESLTAAAMRETREEAGVEVALRGVLVCESSRRTRGAPQAWGSWRRVIFYGEPAAADGGGGEDDGEGGGGDGVGGGGSSSEAARGRGEEHSATASSGTAGAKQQQQQQASGCSLPARFDSPKSVPDFESAGACWLTLEQLARVPVRSASEVEWMYRVGGGMEVPPLRLPEEWVDEFADFEF